MTFEQYLQLEEAKTEHSMNTAVFATGDTAESIDKLLDSTDENVLTARIVKGVAYCLYHKRFIDLNELAKQVKALYINKGFMGSGFSKLDPKDFVLYTSAKMILKKLFDSETYTVKIDPVSAAKYFYAADYMQS